ncbi:hypothetical protein NDNC_0350 [Candidatus Nasuia deltocephalinicola]|uniref:Uncharacterized protein n=1 Tax=Candidatus Nasuia deltocephalincola TaxID=1160784 RepID=A0A974WKM5_9PROT|nr:hypothetical protein CU086_00650 [Candidatus Nasuia deltocephalinicola]BEH03869.1 hypothetical protein NDNC_0350 [Candidatus Nasuia deltocephalinicola]
MINIISGLLKKSNLFFPNKFFKFFNFKPTPFYIKKKVFDWIGSFNNIYCLDIFSCTGNLGFEAASRGCRLSILLEKNKKFFFYLKKNFYKFSLKNVKIFNCNFFYFIKKFNLKNTFFNLIFIDSSYIILNDLIKSLKIILKILKPNSYIYIETIFNIELFIKKFSFKFIVLKNFFFGKINFFLLKTL